MLKFVMRCNDELIKAVDKYVDGKRFKSRNQLISIVLADWVSKQEHPIDLRYRYSSMKEAEDSVAQIRYITRQRLLGEDWIKYKAQGADLLDGNWDTDCLFEEMERDVQVTERAERDAAAILRGLPDDMPENQREKIASTIVASQRKLRQEIQEDYKRESAEFRTALLAQLNLQTETDTDQASPDDSLKTEILTQLREEITIALREQRDQLKAEILEEMMPQKLEELVERLAEQKGLSGSGSSEK